MFEVSVTNKNVQEVQITVTSTAATRLSIQLIFLNGTNYRP